MYKNRLKIVYDRETDGRWIAEVSRLPGVLAYGSTKSEARQKVSTVALRTLADKFETGSLRNVVNQLFINDTVASR